MIRYLFGFLRQDRALDYPKDTSGRKLAQY